MLKKLLICLTLTVVILGGIVGYNKMNEKNKKPTESFRYADETVKKTVETTTEAETETEPETEAVDPVDVYLETVKFANEDEYFQGLQQKFDGQKDASNSEGTTESGYSDSTDGNVVDSIDSADGDESFKVNDLNGLGEVNIEDEDTFEPLGKERYDELGSIDYTYSQFDETNQIVAEAGCVIDADSLEILYAKNGMETRMPASTTKLLTALTVMEFLDLDEKVLVGKEQEYVANDASLCGIQEGQQYTVYELLKGMLMCSGNDAAYTLAYYTGLRAYDRLENSEVYEFNENTMDGEYDPSCDDINTYAADATEAQKYIDEFVKYMNKNAQELGCLNVDFKTPDGYDTDDQYVTALDLARIGVMAKRNDVVSDICATKSYYAKSLDVTWTTTNELMKEDSEFYNEYVDGLKTGSTGGAGKCFVSSASKNGNNLISVVLGSDYNGRWNDTNYLVESGFGYLGNGTE